MTLVSPLPVSVLQPLLLFLIFPFCLCMFCAYMSVYYLHAAPEEARRGRQIPWDLSDGRLGVTVWMLGIVPQSFGRAASALNNECLSMNP